jgi:hypothetical protein
MGDFFHKKTSGHPVCGVACGTFLFMDSVFVTTDARFLCFECLSVHLATLMPVFPHSFVATCTLALRNNLSVCRADFVVFCHG